MMGLLGIAARKMRIGRWVGRVFVSLKGRRGRRRGRGIGAHMYCPWFFVRS